ncbi:methylamine utilization protein MauJ [Collimonas sp. H4R21]|uniref:Methylamine utilization protein MauJ n=1 Tax=Collimonas rhizosphaerae TaxID=3126357 RepID=A0ABU9PZ03_9BURK
MAQSPSPSTNISYEDLGPPGVRGELHVLALMKDETRKNADRLNDSTTRQFKLAARLAKFPVVTEGIKGDFNENDGGSYLLRTKDSAFSRIRCTGGTFEVRTNQAGEHSLLEFECEATSTTDARNKFLAAVLPFLDCITYHADSPLFITSVRIEDIKNQRITIDYIAPYRHSTVNPHTGSPFLELLPVYAMYREAKNSSSDFYKFLCYHKLLEGLFGARRTELFRTAKNNGLTITRVPELIPDAPAIDTAYRQYIGKPIKGFFDTVLTPRFRNAVAHFITDDGAVLNMSAPEHIDSYSGVLYITELCVRTVIDNYQRMLTEFYDQQNKA